MMRLHSILPGRTIWLPFLPIRLGFLMWPLNPAAATTGISIMQRVGRTDSDLCQWPGILSGVGEKAQELFPGDVVNIPAGVKHWHGATPYRWFSVRECSLLFPYPVYFIPLSMTQMKERG
ncbi:hypothetical protein C810_02140 [Lachnospiraceae bacterium A2]|nr:hypothetical protein C810_02140 [Lachnospiraceae bacterium A2]